MERLYFIVVNAFNNLVISWLVEDKSWLRDCGILFQLEGNFSVVEKGMVNPLADDLHREGSFVRTEAILCNWDGRGRGYRSPKDGEDQRNFGGAMSKLYRKGFVGL